MPRTFLSQSFNGKPVISVTNGQVIGRVEDMLVDPVGRRVAAVIILRGSLLKRDIGSQVEGFLSDKIEVWGQDSILVTSPDVMFSQECKSPDLQRWVSVANQLRGREIIDTDGTRVGIVNDIVIDGRGRIVAYDLGPVFIVGPVAEWRRIPIEATRTLGQDVLMVALHEARSHA